MTRYEIDTACGQTPCICGEIETWHAQCYFGKTPAEIKSGYDRAYRIAGRKLKNRAKQMLSVVMAKAST